MLCYLERLSDETARGKMIGSAFLKNLELKPE